MAFLNEKTLDAVQIRDTSAHNGVTVDNQGLMVKTVIIENGLNQPVSLQCQGSASADFLNFFNLGSSFDADASANSYQTCTSYIPYFRVVATCAVAPSSGALTVYIFKFGGA